MSKIEDGSNRGIPREAGSPRISKSTVNFFQLVGGLSDVERQGWVDRGINNPESVAEHSYQVAFMTMVEATRRGLDVQRSMGMALIHDLPERFAGDITPHEHLSGLEREEAINSRWIQPTEEVLEQKRQREEDALQQIMKRSPIEIRSSILELWDEYKKGETEEAKLVHQMDRLQRLLQAKSYLDEEGDSFPIASFLEEALASEDPELRRTAREMQRNIGYIPGKQPA